MTRALLYIAKLALVVAAAVWLAYQPGQVSIDFLGYRIETAVGILVLAVFLVAVLATIVYRYWRLFLDAPGSIGRSFREGRRRRGYKALTQGMVAVAAGDKEEARKWARKAAVLKEEPPLTLLLAAQAAQLEGDDQAAKRYFHAMLESDETRFLGLRGCLMQALREGDKEAALDFVREAHAMRPKTQWVLTAMFELTQATGDLEGAQQALKQAVRYKALPAAEGERKQAVVLLQQAEAAQRRSDTATAQKRARAALKLAPDLVPATTLLAETLIDSGRPGEAERLIERAWARGPHPDLLRLYRTLASGEALPRFEKIKRLTAAKPEHEASLLALADAALDAKLWGEARRYLGDALKAGEAEGPSESVCRAMARLEEQEYGDAPEARSWLVRAASARRDPAWVCGSCGASAERWSAHCGACNAFDALSWRRAVRVSPDDALAAPDEEVPTIEAEPARGALVPAGESPRRDLDKALT